MDGGRMSDTPQEPEELPRAVAVAGPMARRTGVAAELEAAAIALLTAVAAGSLLMIFAAASPLDVWSTLLSRTFGATYGIGQVLFRATPLVLTGLAVAVPLRAGLVNIGGEGQMIVAALACAFVGAALPAGTPAVIALPIVLATAAAAGGALGAATGAFRVYRGAHEVIVAIMFNFVVAGVALYLGNKWLFVGGATRTATIVAGAQFAELGITGSSASYSIVVALLAAGAVGWVQTRSITGYRWSPASTSVANGSSPWESRARSPGSPARTSSSARSTPGKRASGAIRASWASRSRSSRRAAPPASSCRRSSSAPSRKAASR
jgi:ABC-type uncharacterized transport system permease subunit